MLGFVRVRCEAKSQRVEGSHGPAEQRGVALAAGKVATSGAEVAGEKCLNVTVLQSFL